MLAVLVLEIDRVEKNPNNNMDSQVAVALALSLVGGVSTSIGTLLCSLFHLHSFNIFNFNFDPLLDYYFNCLFLYLCQLHLLMKAYHHLFVIYLSFEL